MRLHAPYRHSVPEVPYRWLSRSAPRASKAPAFHKTHPFGPGTVASGSHSKAYPFNLAGPLIPHPAVPYLTSRRSISLASKARTPRILLTPLPSQYEDVNLDTAVSVARIPPVWLQRRAPLHDPVFYIGGLSMPLPVLLQIANHGLNMCVPINFPHSVRLRRSVCTSTCQAMAY